MQLPERYRKSTNQRWGDFAEQASGHDVGVYASGLRNAFDLVVGGATTLVYCQDNGSNKGFGPMVDGYDHQKNTPDHPSGNLPIVVSTDEEGG